MAWYEEAVFYHIYPLGLCGCSRDNVGENESHFDQLNAWAEHAKNIGCTAIYIGPLFESVGHGYETTDYCMVDRRIGTNDDFKNFVSKCHQMGVKVIVDGVFNHTGREFFAFKDVKANRENSRYRDWYLDVNFWGNNEYNDGFSYQNWGGHNLLVKLNVRNPEVKNYLFDSVRFWVSEFNIDGIRLDAADVLDQDFMSELRGITDTLKPEFWLMGEVIHGDYSKWANGNRLHSVTNYDLHKGLYSGHNDHNYFEIAHTIKRINGNVGNTRLYIFADNHDVERIYTKLNNKAHMFDITLLLYTVYGIPSIYYGSEFCIEGRKENGSDWGLRPYLDLNNFKDAIKNNEITRLITRLGQLKKDFKELTYGDYKELALTNRQFAFARTLNGSAVITVLNNDDGPAHMEINLPVAANTAVDLLLQSEEEIVTNEVVEDNKINEEAIEAANQVTNQLVTLEKLVLDIKAKASVGEEIREDVVYSQEVLSKVQVSMGNLLDSVKIQPTTAPIVINENSQVEIRDGRLIVDVPANRGMLIYVTMR